MTSELASRETSDAGYSLLELLILLAVIAASVMVVVPRAMATRDTMQLNAAAQRLAAALVKARADSIALSMPRDVVLDPQRTAYMDQHAVTRRIANGAAMSASGFMPDASSRRMRVRFRPDGTATGGTIVLRKKRAATSIAVDWLTGAVRVKRLR